MVVKHVKFAVKYTPRIDFPLKNDYLYAPSSKNALKWLYLRLEVIGIFLIFVLSTQILYIMGNNLEIFGKPISELKRFTKFGDEFTFMEHNPEKNTYLYKRVNIDTGFVCYEVVIPRRMRNPDGSIVYVYPGAENFGFGRGICTRSLERAEKYLENGCSRLTSGA